jgi:hypothetical protein
MSAGDNMTSMANNLTMEMDDKYSAGGQSVLQVHQYLFFLFVFI